MDPMTMALITAGISAAGSVGGAALSNKKPKESQTQKQKRLLIDAIKFSKVLLLVVSKEVQV